MANQQQVEKKLRKLNTRYKDLGKVHGVFCLHVDLVLRELDGLKGRDVHLPPLVNSLRVALQGAKRSHQPGTGAALPAAPHGPRSAPPATVAPAKARAGRQQAPREPLPGPAAPVLPPVPLDRALAALHRARAALVTRQAQLAACRTCGSEAAAYQQAAADVETLGTWLAQTCSPAS